MSYLRIQITIFVFLVSVISTAESSAQRVDELLKSESAETLAIAAKETGDARQGAILFYQQAMACRKCHLPNKQGAQLGPKLSEWEKQPTDNELIESILFPSRSIRKGFESVTLVEESGKIHTGILVKADDDSITYRSLESENLPQTISKRELEEIVTSKQSLMPEGLVNLLANRQQFLDLLKYLMEIRDGGEKTARLLKPPLHLYAVPPIPAYEQSIDHAGFLSELNQSAFKRGEAIYNRLCVNCHGTKDKEGSLPTSLKFASGRFRNGSDPYSMYQTITRGFGMMQPQFWMVPQQKYDVIHYIREAYLKPHNPSQYVNLTPDYLSGLPKGAERGPAPLSREAWVAMNYGDSLINTYEAGQGSGNFSYKGIAVRLDSGPGGIAQGQQWMVFDHDTLRMSAAWSGQGFIDWDGIHFNGKHGVHPGTVGNLRVFNPVGPGWAHPETGSWDDPRLRGRDNKPYGPLPRNWAQYKGLYRHGHRRIISYTVGETSILESPVLLASEPSPVFARQLKIEAHEKPLRLSVATLPEDEAYASRLLIDRSENGRKKFFPLLLTKSSTDAPQADRLRLDGSSYAEVDNSHKFDLTNHDFSVTARIKTEQGGTIFSQTENSPKWVPDGKALFVRGGRLCYDIGWVGVVTSRKRVDDGRWHDVALAWDHETARVRLFIDGKLDQTGSLRPKKPQPDQVVRLGFAAPNFPSRSFLEGELQEVRFYDSSGTPAELKQQHPVSGWELPEIENGKIKDKVGTAHASVIRGANPRNDHPARIVVGVEGDSEQIVTAIHDRRVIVEFPPSDRTNEFTVWFSAFEESVDASSVHKLASASTGVLPALDEMIQGGPADWPELITTVKETIHERGPFAADELTLPTDNPWDAQVRATGFDFEPDGNTAYVSMWDGDVWKVSGLLDDRETLTWQRIASGLFQPLGLKLVDGKVYVSCRDQIVILHDLNHDGETDYYENFNNDHQVTEHFHEFAMGLQTDAEGNFYYAKSARHALTAIVPHHGTLLRVSKDGTKTVILATGFRAANGVCLNPDGSFIVTDQEGHWNPKNRINWVREEGFYGNMYGYHDVTDESDDAMEQPLCWITNNFDRSPAELLWVPEDTWGKLGGSLLNLSYGYGKVFLVPHENVEGQMQGGMIELPLPQFPTGLIRGRFHPVDKQLYVCGMVAWASSQRTPGGFYRIRKTNQSAHLPVKLEAKQDGMMLEFTDAIDAESASDPENYAVRAWDLKRTKNYGSKHFNEREWEVTKVDVGPSGKTLFLTIPDIAPTWGMEIRYFLKTPEGEPIEGMIHNTIHHLSGE